MNEQMQQFSRIWPVLVLAAAIIAYFILKNKRPREVCWQGTSSGRVVKKCKPICEIGSFGLPGMEYCNRLLTCADWGEVKYDTQDLIGKGLVKRVYKGAWKSFDVAVNQLSDRVYHDDFDHGWEMITAFQHSPFVVQMVGRCENVYLTEYHYRKSAQNIHMYLRNAEQNLNSEILTRFNLCINYVEILNFLHNSPLGVRVMCDTSDLWKTLNQFLITDDLHLVANDLDALPEVVHANGTLVKCGARELWGDFVAPEQLWPFEDMDFNDNMMPSYDEKTDIWKIPEVCNHFMADIRDSKGIRLELLKIHQTCKEMDPSNRPSAASVLQQYKTIKDRFLT